MVESPTGRLTRNTPELQNIPVPRTELGDEFRRFMRELRESEVVSFDIETIGLNNFDNLFTIPTRGLPLGAISVRCEKSRLREPFNHRDYAVIEGRIMQRFYKDGQPTETFFCLDMEGTMSIEEWMKEIYGTTSTQEEAGETKA